MRSSILGIWGTIVCAALAACGGGSGGGSEPLASPLTISPSSATVNAGASQAFSATGGFAPYRFSIPTGSGSINADTGQYTAPNIASTVVVRVTDSRGSTADSTVTVRAPLSVIPATPIIGVGTQQQLQASGGQSPYTYSVTAGQGTIDATGTFFAPGQPGTSTIRIADAAGASLLVNVTINPALSAFPDAITMTASSGQAQAFTGVGGAPPYTYVVQGAGTIDAAGRYVAGTSSGRATVRVRDAQGSTATASVDLVAVRTNGAVRAAVNDGTSWWIAGDFTSVHPHLAGGAILLDAQTGDPQLACNLGVGFNGQVTTIARSTTHYFVGGDFTRYRGQPANRLAKISVSNCALDTAFMQGSGFNAAVRKVVTAGEAVYALGSFSSYRGTSVGSLIKLNALTGAVDTAFDPPIVDGDRIEALVASSNGVYIGGIFVLELPAQTLAFLAKLDLNTGAVDRSFARPDAFDNNVTGLLLDGAALYVWGLFDSVAGRGTGGLVKLDATTGNADTAFAAQDGVVGTVYDLSIAGNALFVGGFFSEYRGAPVRNIVKLNKNSGAVDSGFTPGTSTDEPIARVVASGNSVYIGGNFSTYQGLPAAGIAKLDASTAALDRVFTRSTGFDQTAFIPQRYVVDLHSSPDGLFVGGNFRAYRGFAAPKLAKISVATGERDPVFNTPASADRTVIALARDGSSLYFGGSFSRWGDQPYRYFLKIDANTGAVDPTFNQATGIDGNPVTAITVSGSSVYVGGAFSSYRGVARSSLARLNKSNGDLDQNFTALLSAGVPVWSIDVLGTQLLVAGSFFPGIVKLDAATGAADRTFGASGGPFLSVVVSGSSFFGGGQFQSYSGELVDGLVKASITDGALDRSFSQLPGFQRPIFGAFSLVNALSLSNGSLYAAGLFESYRGLPVGSIAKLDPLSGSLDPNFTRADGFNGIVNHLSSLNNQLWVGGDFTEYRGQRAYFFVPIDQTTGAEIPW